MNTYLPTQILHTYLSIKEYICQITIDFITMTIYKMIIHIFNVNNDDNLEDITVPLRF